MHATLTRGTALGPRTLHDQANAEVWDLVRDLEAILPPTQMALVHKLRLASEIVGSMRATAPLPQFSPRGGAGLYPA